MRRRAEAATRVSAERATGGSVREAAGAAADGAGAAAEAATGVAAGAAILVAAGKATGVVSGAAVSATGVAVGAETVVAAGAVGAAGAAAGVAVGAANGEVSGAASAAGAATMVSAGGATDVASGIAASAIVVVAGLETGVASGAATRVAALSAPVTVDGLAATVLSPTSVGDVQHLATGAASMTVAGVTAPAASVGIGAEVRAVDERPPLEPIVLPLDPSFPPSGLEGSDPAYDPSRSPQPHGARQRRPFLSVPDSPCIFCPGFSRTGGILPSPILGPFRKRLSAVGIGRSMPVFVHEVCALWAAEVHRDKHSGALRNVVGAYELGR